MASQAYLRCFLRLTMNGISEDVLPQVELSRADYDRLTNYIALPPREKANFTFEGCPIFLWVETVDGVNLMVSEEDIDLLRLLTQRFPTPTPEPPRQLVEFDSDEDWEEDAAVYDETSTRGQVEIYIRGRSEPVVTSTLDGPDEIAQHFLLMDDPDALKMYLEADGEFIFFTDDDGEEVGVRPSQVVLIVAHPGSLDFGFMEDY